jgi:hypothetical protein
LQSIWIRAKEEAVGAKGVSVDSKRCGLRSVVTEHCSVKNLIVEREREMDERE